MISNGITSQASAICVNRSITIMRSLTCSIHPPSLQHMYGREDFAIARETCKVQYDGSIEYELAYLIRLELSEQWIGIAVIL
jgi:hypothetical protein